MQSSADVIVMSHTNSNLLRGCNCNPFGNVEKLHCARHCIGCKWLMDQMCSKCKKHCFSHDLFDRSFGKFPEIFFLSEFVFFIEVSLTKLFFC